MTVLIVLAMVIAFLLIDYAIQLRHAKAPARVTASGDSSTAASQLFFQEGVFLLPNHLWSVLLPSGQIKIGIDRLITHSVGKVDQIVLPKKGTTIKKGDHLLILRQGDRTLHFASPMDGTITEVNVALAQNPQAIGKNIDQAWAISFRPTDLSAALPAWHVGERARKWLKAELERMRQFFTSIVAEPSLAHQTAQDGGTLAPGLLEKLDASTWQKFEQAFLCSESAMRGDEQG